MNKKFCSIEKISPCIFTAEKKRKVWEAETMFVYISWFTAPPFTSSCCSIMAMLWLGSCSGSLSSSRGAIFWFVSKSGLSSLSLWLTFPLRKKYSYRLSFSTMTLHSSLAIMRTRYPYFSNFLPKQRRIGNTITGWSFVWYVKCFAM